AARGGALRVAAAARCWSTGGLIARTVDADPWTIVFWRGLACAGFLLVVIAAREGLAIGPVFGAMGASGLAMGASGLAMAGCFATASTCFILALRDTSVAN